jgi:hypothetical protein
MLISIQNCCISAEHKSAPKKLVHISIIHLTTKYEYLFIIHDEYFILYEYCTTNFLPLLNTCEFDHVDGKINKVTCNSIDMIANASKLTALSHVSTKSRPIA